MTQQSNSWYIPRKDENSNLKRYMHPNVHSSTIYKAKTWKPPKHPPTNDCLKKRWYIFVCVSSCVCIYIIEYYSVINKNEISPFAAT